MRMYSSRSAIAGKDTTLVSGYFSMKRPAGSSTCHRVMIIRSPAWSAKREKKSSIIHSHTPSRIVGDRASALPFMGSSITPSMQPKPVDWPFTVGLRKPPPPTSTSRPFTVAKYLP
jgi:hypothetical protein